MIIREVFYENFKLINHDGKVIADGVSQEIANHILPKINSASCFWKFRESDHSYETSCGKAFQFNEGDAAANGVTHCMYCGCSVEDVDE